MRSFKLKTQYMPIFDKMKDEDVGKIFKALYKYAETGEVEDLGDLELIFTLFQIDIDNYAKEIHYGENSHYWKGGISKENHKIRTSSRYRQWRKEVFERDNYTCQICKQVGGKLNAHHIEKFSENELKRFDASNGITLCAKCHREVHKNER